MSKCEQCIVIEFSSLKTLNKNELIRIANCKTSLLVKRGGLLFEEGDFVNGIYCVTSGVCKLSKLSPNGKDQIVKIVKAGELLGQRSIISDDPAYLSAIALEDMEVCFIPKNEIINMFDTNNTFSMNVMKTICGDLKETSEHLVSNSQKTVKERLAETLVYLQTNFGKNDDGSLCVQLSREELAGMIGTATESCIRLLSNFNKNGWVELIGKKIVIKDLSKLKRIAGIV